MSRSAPMLLAALALAIASPSGALSIDFDSGDFAGFGHGSVVADPMGGYTDFDLEVTNFNRKFDLAVTFDTTVPDGGPTPDQDLVRGSGWAGGNIASAHLGNILILQENTSGCGTGTCSDPDDEGESAAGKFHFDLKGQIFQHFSFVAVDIEGTSKDKGDKFGDLPSTITFFLDGEVIDDGVFDFMEFLGLGQNVVFGNNTANQITLNDVGDYDAFEIELGGSGGIDGIRTSNKPIPPVPEPGTLSLLALGTAGLGAVRRRSRS